MIKKDKKQCSNCDIFKDKNTFSWHECYQNGNAVHIKICKDCIMAIEDGHYTDIDYR